MKNKLFGARCIIFDFDGVILESEVIKEKGFHHVFRHDPAGAAAVADYLLEYPGQSRGPRIAGIHLAAHGAPIAADRLAPMVAEFADYVHDRVLHCDEVPGARRFLAMRSPQIPLYLSSATPEDELQDICARRGLSQYFRGIYGAPDSKVVHIRRILAATGLAPDNCLFIGDSPSDLVAASACGLMFLARQSSVNIDHLACDRFRSFPVDVDQPWDDECLP